MKIVNTSNLLAILFIVIFISNFSPPPFIGFMVEFYFICNIFSKNFTVLIIIIYFLFLGSFFCVYLVVKITAGKKSYEIFKNSNFRSLFFILINTHVILFFL